MLLPPNNRISESIRPEEYFWRWKDSDIHIDRYINQDAKAKVILLHGVGGNGRLLSFIGGPLYRNGFEVIAPDLPGYGLTICRSNIDYRLWIDMVHDLILEELEKDEKPIFLFGLSAGGMLAYQVACLNNNISGLIATNVLDQRNQQVRDASATNKYVSKIGIPILRLLHFINNDIKLPMKLVTNMRAIVNDKKLLKLLLADRTSSGANVPINLMLSLITSKPQIEPEEFTDCPFLLVHPEKDNWTPLELSLLFFDRLKCKKEITILENAGHFPIEEPGITQLEISVVEFINRIIG